MQSAGPGCTQSLHPRHGLGGQSGKVRRASSDEETESECTESILACSCVHPKPSTALVTRWDGQDPVVCPVKRPNYVSQKQSKSKSNSNKPPLHNPPPLSAVTFNVDPGFINPAVYVVCFQTHPYQFAKELFHPGEWLTQSGFCFSKRDREAPRA